jgi:hypothetical protein
VAQAPIRSEPSLTKIHLIAGLGALVNSIQQSAQEISVVCGNRRFGAIENRITATCAAISSANFASSRPDRLMRIFQSFSFDKLHCVEVVRSNSTQVEDGGHVLMSDTGCCTCLKTKPSRFITKVFVVDDLQRHRTSQINVECLVSYPIAPRPDSISFPSSSLTTSKWSKRSVPLSTTVALKARSEQGSVSSFKALRKVQIGQNSTAPENSLPHPGQIRLSSVFMALAALPMQPERRKAHESPRRSLPDLKPSDRLPLATVRCTAFATDGQGF